MTRNLAGCSTRGLACCRANTLATNSAVNLTTSCASCHTSILTRYFTACQTPCFCIIYTSCCTSFLTTCLTCATKPHFTPVLLFGRDIDKSFHNHLDKKIDKLLCNHTYTQLYSTFHSLPDNRLSCKKTYNLSNTSMWFELSGNNPDSLSYKLRYMSISNKPLLD